MWPSYLPYPSYGLPGDRANAGEEKNWGKREIKHAPVGPITTKHLPEVSHRILFLFDEVWVKILVICIYTYPDE